MISISKNGKYLGSICADRVICDPEDNYLMFMRKNECIAYFPYENIEIENEKYTYEQMLTDFAVYQSNRV